MLNKCHHYALKIASRKLSFCTIVLIDCWNDSSEEAAHTVVELELLAAMISAIFLLICS